MRIMQMFMEGGAPMYGVAAVDFCAVVLVPLALLLAILARFTNKMRTLSLVLGWVAVASTLLPIGVGVGGYLWGMHRVEAAVAYADPEQRAMLLQAGTAEASNNLYFGFGSGCACLVPALLALILVPPKPVVYDDP